MSDISQTRANMSSTVNEIEQRLSPAHLKEQIADIKDSALGQYHEAKDHLKGDLAKEYQEAKGKLEQEMAEARQRINQEIEHARQAVHDATVGKVEHMVHDAKDTVREAKTTAFQVVKANPIPAALVAVGIGWLLVSARSSGGSTGVRRVRGRRDGRDFDDRYGYRGAYRNEYDRFEAGRGRQGYEGYERFEAGQGRQGYEEHSALGDAFHEAQSRVTKLGHRIEEGATEVGHKVQELGHKVQEGASGLAQQARGAAHDVSDTVGSLAHRAGEGVGQLAHRAEEGMEHLAQGTREVASHLASDASRVGRSAYRGVESGVQRAERGFEDAMWTNPLAVGAVALAVGAAVGLALPHTEREDEWVGEARDRLFDRAQTAAHDALEAVEQKAEAFAGELGSGDDGRSRRAHHASA